MIIAGPSLQETVLRAWTDFALEFSLPVSIYLESVYAWIALIAIIGGPRGHMRVKTSSGTMRMQKAVASAVAMGYIYIYISIEAQKPAGSLHAHAQVHIECLHQHCTIREVMEEVQRRGPTLIKDYLRYKHHVCREEYEDPEGRESRQVEIEGTWPDYRDSVALVSTRRYLQSDMDGTSWREKYLKEHVQTIQEMKQHHVHTFNSKGERVPLTHCRRADNPNKCRADFPRTHWLIKKGVVLCKGIMQRMGMSLGGKKNKLGSSHGPRTEENPNGTHPALCASPVPLCRHGSDTRFQ